MSGQATKINITVEQRAAQKMATGGKLPSVPYAVPYGIGQYGWPGQCRRQSVGRADLPSDNALGQRIPLRKHGRIEEQAGGISTARFGRVRTYQHIY